jgi:hypothetical protein
MRHDGEEGRAVSGDQGSGFEWRRKRGRVNRALERVEDVPWNLLSRRGLLTDSAKRKLYEKGVPGRAEILGAPGEHAISAVGENIGRFHVRIELPGREPYTVSVTQSFRGGYESDGLKEGALVECRVDPKNEKRVLLLAPEPDERKVSVVDSSQILSKGKRASATVNEAKDLEMTAPGTDDPIYLLGLELRSDDEPDPWDVEIAQRVPKRAEKLVHKGGQLTAAYLEVDEGDSVAIDWDAAW